MRSPRIRDEPDPDPRGARAAGERGLRPDPAAPGRAGFRAVAEEISELFELRALLEPRLLRLSAPRLTAEDHAALDAINAEYRAEIRAMNPGRWGELNTNLHLTLMSRAEQPRTLAIVAALLQNADRWTRLQLSLTGSGRTRAEKEHAAMVRLCRAGDVVAACKLLKAHIRHAEAMLVAFIKARSSAARVSAGSLKWTAPSRRAPLRASGRWRHRDGS